MRMLRLRVAPLRVPEVGGLTVDRIFRRAVFLVTFLAVHVSDRPTFVTQRLAVSIQQIQFGDGGELFSIMRVQRFDAEIVPDVRLTLESTRKALGSVEGSLSSDAPLQQDIRESLRELTRAAQSLRTLTDYLERHPEAIIRGKQEDTP